MQWYQDRKEGLLKWSASESLVSPQVTQQEPENNTSVSDDDLPPPLAAPNAPPADVVPGKMVGPPAPAPQAVVQVDREEPAEGLIPRAKKILKPIFGWSGLAWFVLALPSLWNLASRSEIVALKPATRITLQKGKNQTRRWRFRYFSALLVQCHYFFGTCFREDPSLAGTEKGIRNGP